VRHGQIAIIKSDQDMTATLSLLDGAFLEIARGDRARKTATWILDHCFVIHTTPVQVRAIGNTGFHQSARLGVRHSGSRSRCIIPLTRECLFFLIEDIFESIPFSFAIGDVPHCFGSNCIVLISFGRSFKCENSYCFFFLSGGARASCRCQGSRWSRSN